MDSINEIVSKLQSIVETVEILSVKDIDGWQSVCLELTAACSQIPDAYSSFCPFFNLSARGINAVIQKTDSKILFAVVNAVTNGLIICKRCLEEEHLPDDFEETAIEPLHQILSDADFVLTDERPASVGDDNSMESLLSNLNGLAALWVQREPDDTEGVEGIKQMLTDISGHECLSDAARVDVLRASEILDAILGSEVDNPAESWAEAGTCIELAIQILENPGTIRERKPSFEMDNSEGQPVETDAGHERTPGAETGYEPPAQDDQRDYMPREADLELIGEFIAEAKDLIAHAEEALLELEVDPENMDAVGTVFRAFHTIKGTSAFLELAILSEMGHHAESLLSRVREKEIRYAGGYADLALRSLDMLKTLIASVESALGGNPLIKPEGYDALMEVLINPEAAGISEEMEEAPSARLGDILVSQGKADREAVEDLVQRQSGKPLGMEIIQTGTASVTDVGRALRTQERMKGTKQQFVETSVRVSTDRLDRLIDMVGEMVIAHSMVAQDQVVIQSSHYELLKKVNHTSKIVRGLQDLCMSMRMVPLKATFQKMARLVRDVARKVGKNVTFVTEGEDTEIDRNLVDIINDPLVHMVRNAVDHGIELPEIRQKKGKPIHGVVKLSAYHSAGSVVVQIIDDGKGLDRNAIIAKAIEKGMITEGASMCDRDVYNLVLEPGFSTAEVVTDVSGRGVGMDVVKKNIESLRGQVEIQSEPGKGSVFRMSLPLTLAIIDGMVLRAGHETYVIPTVSIVRTIKPEPRDISSVFNSGQVLSLQGKLIPLYQLTRLYGIEGGRDAREGLVVVIEDDGNQAGLIIDELVGRQQVVIKTLGETMQQIPGISGGAIMPNGRVGLIVDIAGLMKLVAADRSEKKEEKFGRP